MQLSFAEYIRLFRSEYKTPVKHQKKLRDFLPQLKGTILIA